MNDRLLFCLLAPLYVLLAVGCLVLVLPVVIPLAIMTRKHLV